jgi:16S rRNA (guanine527-N7)-methyltransferase
MEKAASNLELIIKYFPNITVRQLEQFAALSELYSQWNEKINVISRKDIDSLYEKHVLHSLSIAKALEFNKNDRVIDIGTGGGFPGIPLAIFFPDVQFHLTDSIGKKIKVVDEVWRSIGLKNVTSAHIRAEDIRKRHFDVSVSRAVAPLKELWQWSNRLLNPGKGTIRHQASLPDQRLTANGLVCLKGGDLTMEIKESGTNPSIIEISKFFEEEYFRSKYIVHISPHK